MLHGDHRTTEAAGGGGDSSAERSQAARAILERIFRNVPFGLAARLWDGTQVLLGSERSSFTLVFRSPDAFRRLMLRPNTLRFAEAYVGGDLEIEGDIFTAIRLANRIEALRLGLRDRIAILLALAKL
jgi:cyclopropane-fatty-acyl-phospholipid synthase